MIRVEIILDDAFRSYPKEAQLVKDARLQIEEKINSFEFADWVRNHQYVGQTLFAETIDSNEEVLRKIYAGDELVTGLGADGIYQYTVIPFYSNNNVLGYTYPNRHEIWVNMKFYQMDWWGVDDVAGNLTHEQMHKLGYNHTFQRTWKWNYTVPYAVGYKVREMVRNNPLVTGLEEAPKITPKVDRPDTSKINKTMPRMGRTRRFWYKFKNFFRRLV